MNELRPERTEDGGSMQEEMSPGLDHSEVQSGGKAWHQIIAKHAKRVPPRTPTVHAKRIEME